MLSVIHNCNYLLALLLIQFENFNMCLQIFIHDFRHCSVTFACIVTLYKGKDKYECSDSRGVSLRSIVGKLYGKVVIERVRDGT